MPPDAHEAPGAGVRGPANAPCPTCNGERYDVTYRGAPAEDGGPDPCPTCNGSGTTERRPDQCWQEHRCDICGTSWEATTLPVLVATAVSYCVTHEATDHDDGRAWEACRFRQLFYFENPMDEHTVMWSDEIVNERGSSDG